MKQWFMMAVMAVVIFACGKEESSVRSDSNGEAMVMVSIQVDGSIDTRAVEDGHGGASGQEMMPRILSVTLIPYNEYGAEISQIDLSSDQMKKALWGKGNDAGGVVLPGVKPAGASVGLPAGTKNVDVVVNRPSGVNSGKVTNINYFNYRSDLADKGDNTPGTTNNYERVYLTTAEYGMGQELGAATSTTPDGTPLYDLSFTVAPSVARFEVFGAINVKPEETWVDGYGSGWRVMERKVFEDTYMTLHGLTLNPTSGAYTYKKMIAGVETEVTFRNVVAGTTDNGFEQTQVFFPEYYWYDVTGVGTPTALDKANTLTEDQVDADPATGAAWVKNNDLGASALVKWYPNMFYAVDVEAVFINNIKVRGPGFTPYMHSWPGDQSAEGWPDWYKAYHIGGWHTTGSSTGNTFLCMGNMWDRIAKTKNPATDEKTITFPSLTTPGAMDNMNIIVGKAIPESGKSTYYMTGIGERNLGVETGKASAFQIYSQSIAGTASKEQVMTSLPHVLLKVKAYKGIADYADGDYVKGKEFITIKAFKQGSTFVTNFKNATIYRVNLNDLLGNFVGQVPVPGGKPSVTPKDPIDPDPEMPGSQLNITVQIVPWTIQNITPDI